MLAFLKNLYDVLPTTHLTFLRKIPDRILFGKMYKKALENMSFDMAASDVFLADALNYAREFTRFGRDNIPKDVSIHNALRVLESLPMVSSEDISNNLEYYTSREFNSFNSFTTTTGGTGRNPTTIKISNELFGIEWAYVHNIWGAAGYDRKKHTKLTLRGKSLSADRIVEYNPIYNEVVVDTFKLSASNAIQVADAMKKFNVTYIHGYPSLVKECMEYFEVMSYTPELQGVFLVSEASSVELKKQIKDFFGCPVISFYGQSERALIAADFDGNGFYRVYTSYGYPRVVNNELVVTSFVNKALPLINYRVGDSADIVVKDGSLYLTNVTSRWGKDFIYLSKEKKISTAALNLHSAIQSEIIYCQIHQYTFGEIELKIVPKSHAKLTGERLRGEIERQFSEKLKDFTVKSSLVSQKDITKSARGKMMYLVQHISAEAFHE